MKAISRRLRRLEDQFGPPQDFLVHPRDHFRLVLCPTIGRANLATSTCKRTLTASGALTEVVRLNGRREGLTDAELDAFVATFPVERI